MNNQQPSTSTAENENVIENENLLVNNNTHNQPIVNIIEVSNVYPTNLIKHNLHSSQRRIISGIRAEAYDTCRGKLPHEYIRLAFNAFKSGYVYTINNKISAFCIWKIRHSEISMKNLNQYNEMNIYLICGIKLDYQLVPRIFDDIIHYCRKNNVHYVALKAANDQLKNYYIANGFTPYTDIAGDNNLRFDVSRSRITYPETRTAPAQTRRRSHRN